MLSREWGGEGLRVPGPAPLGVRARLGATSGEEPPPAPDYSFVH